MIVKKIANPKKSAGKEERIRGLTAYIRAPERTDRTEKCVYAGARGFLTEAPHAQTAEMVALALDCVRSKDPVNHYVLSWREGEQPSEAQIEEAVTVFLCELGLEENQAIYGLHADTENCHLHIAVNRVHPESGRCVEINRGFDLEAAHRAVAKIEEAQGWQTTRHYERGGEARPRQPGQRTVDREQRTGEKSAQRMGMEEAAPIIKAAATWQELHRELGKLGMAYRKTGSGATIQVGEIIVKASTVSRDASLAKLQARLGPYEPPREDIRLTKREPKPLQPDMEGWKDYAASRKQYYAAVKTEKAEQNNRQAQERISLHARQKEQRLHLTQGRPGNWRGRGGELNTLRSLMAGVQAKEKAELRARHTREREAFRKSSPPYPDFKSWLKLCGQEELAEAWRYRKSEPPARIYGDRHTPATTEARDIRNFTARVAGRKVFYSRQGEQTAAFVDHGRRIAVHRTEERENVLAALQLGAQKWGILTLSGSERFLALCVALAAEHGFKISNPGLQARAEQERERISETRRAATITERVEQIMLAAQTASTEDWLRYAREQMSRARKQCYDSHYNEEMRKAEKRIETLEKRHNKAQKAYDALKQQEPQRNGVFNFGYERKNIEWQRKNLAAGHELREAKQNIVTARSDARQAAEKAAQQAVEALVNAHFQPVVAHIATEERRIRQLQGSQTYRSRSVGGEITQR